MTSNESLVGTLLDARYLVGERIARGGMASVYLANDTRLDRVVAVKIMHPGLGDDEDFTVRFRREARSAAKLNHPNVVAVFDQGEDQGYVYLVMEYVPGHTLRDVMRAEMPMPPRRALALVEPLLVALSAAHDARLIHRDVKPENVLIAPDGRIKVADFGLARALSGATSTATGGVLIGTVSYLAPELVVNEGADARSDVYAVGALLYEMLTGQKPHIGDSPIQVAYKHVHEDIPAPSMVVPGIPPYVDALVARATSRDRDQRSADAHVLLQQVRRARNALDQGMDDDVELTQDLRPHRFDLLPPDSVDLDEWPGLPADSDADDRGVDPTVAVTPVDGSGRGPNPGTATGAHPAMSKQAYDDVAPASHSRRGPVLLILVVAVALVAALASYYFGLGRYDDAPDLTGMTVPSAQQRASGLDYKVELSGRAFSENVPKGRIVTTDPGPGGRILPGGTMDAVVSKGKERYAVPDVSGQSQGDARNTLGDLNLKVGDVERRFSDKVDRDVVIRTVLDPGTRVKRDTSVDLVVSKGPRPVEVRDFTGKKASRAVRVLQVAGLRPSIKHAYDDKVAKDDVISQKPSTGTLFEGDTIVLTVSDGPEPVDVPRVVGKGKDNARRILEDAGFEVKVQKERFYVGGGLVLRQDPGGGSQAQPGDTITIYIV